MHLILSYALELFNKDVCDIYIKITPMYTKILCDKMKSTNRLLIKLLN